MIRSKITSGDGTGNEASISLEGALQVVVHAHPPMLETVETLPFSQFFTTTGDASGSRNMIVNGATTPIKFYIKASNEFDIYINSLTVEISDPGAALDRFGAITALTNGIRFFYYSPTLGEYNIAEGIRTNKDFFRDATGGKGFGDGAGSFRADVQAGSGLDTYFPELSFFKRFGMPWGLRLKKASKTIIGFEVRDNLAGLSVFDIKGYGIRI